MKIFEGVGIPHITHRDTTFRLLLLQRSGHTWLELKIAEGFQTRGFLFKWIGNLIAQVMYGKLTSLLYIYIYIHFPMGLKKIIIIIILLIFSGRLLIFSQDMSLIGRKY